MNSDDLSIKNEPISAHFLQVVDKDGNPITFPQGVGYTGSTITTTGDSTIHSLRDLLIVYPTKEEAKILRLQKKCAALREKSLAANKKVKELLYELHYAELRIKSDEKQKDLSRKEAVEYKQKYFELLKDINLSKTSA